MIPISLRIKVLVWWRFLADLADIVDDEIGLGGAIVLALSAAILLATALRWVLS